MTTRLFPIPQIDGSTGESNYNAAVSSDDSGGALGNIQDSAVHVSLTKNLEINNIGIKNQHHNQPFHNDEKSNNTFAIIKSNRHEDNRDIIEDNTHDDDDDNNQLFNVRKFDNEVNINSPTVSNETSNVATDEDGHFGFNNNAMIVPQKNQNINHSQSKVNISSTNDNNP